MLGNSGRSTDATRQAEVHVAGEVQSGPGSDPGEAIRVGVQRAYGVHPNSLALWKDTVLKRGHELFERTSPAEQSGKQIAELRSRKSLRRDLSEVPASQSREAGFRLRARRAPAIAPSFRGAVVRCERPSTEPSQQNPRAGRRIPRPPRGEADWEGLSVSRARSTTHVTTPRELIKAAVRGAAHRARLAQGLEDGVDDLMIEHERQDLKFTAPERIALAIAGPAFQWIGIGAGAAR